MIQKITIADYLLLRLNEIGVRHFFGVPGDYNLKFLDHIEDSQTFTWIGNCNELNAAYAADGYAREMGASALLTTFGVGELSAMNGIAGSFAEDVAVVHVVGMPSTRVQQETLPNHHTFADGNYERFIQSQSAITLTQQIIYLETAAVQIDSAILLCYLKQKPVVIGIAEDLFNIKIDKPANKLNLKLATSDPELLETALLSSVTAIQSAKQPIIIVDAKSRNHGLIHQVRDFINNTNIPYVSTLMAKGKISETNPRFIGEYFGKLSTSSVQDYIDSSDLFIWCGRVDTDLNSGIYTTEHDKKKMIRIDFNQVSVLSEVTLEVNGVEYLQNLTTRLVSYKNTNSFSVNKTTSPNGVGALNQTTFWASIRHIVKPSSTLVIEAGTSMFGLVNQKMPEDVHVISQLLWGSIGYSVGATVGVLVAGNKKNVYLFVGDGSFQLTAQEVSTMLRHGYNPIIFLINNNGYTIERYIHGKDRKYNDIAKWDYCNLVKSFAGSQICWKVDSLKQLYAVEKELDEISDKLRFVEVVLGQDDSPPVMQQVFRSLYPK